MSRPAANNPGTARTWPAGERLMGRRVADWLSSLPREAQLTILVTSTIAAGWINGSLLIQMTGLHKDFGTFYASARSFLNGGSLYGTATAPLQNLNPPHLHLLVLPLALLSPVGAWAIWQATGLVCLVVSLKLILQDLAAPMTLWRAWVAGAALLSAAPTHAIVATGQIAWILMLPLTLLWRSARRGRGMLAGSLFGLLISLKPFLVILAIYFYFEGQIRSLIVGFATALLIFAVGALIFGVDAYVAWVAMLRNVSWSFLPLNASIFGLLTRTLSVTGPIAEGTTRRLAPLINAPGVIELLWVAIASIVVVLTVIACKRAARDRETDRSLAILLALALLISPLGWIYYACFLIGPVLATYQRSDRRGILPLAGLGFFWPIPATTWLQPHGWATAALGSVYFWSMLALWTALAFDARPRAVLVSADRH